MPGPKGLNPPYFRSYLTHECSPHVLYRHLSLLHHGRASAPPEGCRGD